MRGLIVPGLNGSGPDHWQTLWEKRYGFERVEQCDWENPDVAVWVKTLDAAIMAHPEPLVLVAHSLGCFTVILLAGLYVDHTNRVQSALLIAPPDIASSTALPDSTKGFAPHNPGKLPFPSVIVGSKNDPYMKPETAQDLASAIGSRFVNAGFVGHINVDSGHGPWPQGEVLLQNLINKKSLDKCFPVV